MAGLRAQVTGKKLAPLDALLAYTNIIAGQGAVLQAEASSIQDSAPVLQGLGLISAVNTQEDVSEQDAVLASALASGSLTGPDRYAFSLAMGRLQDDTMTYQQLLTPAELQTYNSTFNRLAPTDHPELPGHYPAGRPGRHPAERDGAAGPVSPELAAADKHVAEGREQGGHQQRDRGARRQRAAGH